MRVVLPAPFAPSNRSKNLLSPGEPGFETESNQRNKVRRLVHLQPRITRCAKQSSVRRGWRGAQESNRREALSLTGAKQPRRTLLDRRRSLRKEESSSE